MKFFNRITNRNKQKQISNVKKLDETQGSISRPIMYSWIKTGLFAIGPMPKTVDQWEQLSQAGFRSRFSCCYLYEEIFVVTPGNWPEARVSLPDHRNQEPLRQENLRDALEQARQLIELQPATYIHCWAGCERSALIATGIVALLENTDIFSALDRIRLCHPSASPIYDHLDLLETVLRTIR